MITNWLFWAIPPKYVRTYFFTIYIFGLHFTKLGFIINLLWYDLVFYGWVRAKQAMEGDEE
jgi:hypothetical protein